MTKPHPPPRDPSAHGGGNPAGEELHGTGATQTATVTVRTHSEKPVAHNTPTSDTRHTLAACPHVSHVSTR